MICVFLRREVQVERAFRVAGAFGDLLDLGVVEAALDEDGFGGAEEVDLGVGVGWSGHDGVLDW
jgi:hypothetical protein